MIKFKKLKTLEGLLEEVDRETASFVLLAGGTDIMPAINKGTFAKDVVYDLTPFQDVLHFMKEHDGFIEIGALVGLAEVAENKIVIGNIPQLAKAINSIGSRQIRNMGTLAGNIANASPIADTAPVLLTKDAVVNAVSVNGERKINIDDFFIDYKKTALLKNEIIKSISIPFNNLGGKYGFYKVAVRPEMAISKVNLAWAIDDGGVKFAAGGATKMPIRLKNVEKAWGKKLSAHEWEDILSLDITPITELRSTAEYRRKVLANLLRVI